MYIYTYIHIYIYYIYIYQVPGILLYSLCIYIHIYIYIYYIYIYIYLTGRPGSSEVPRNPLTRWDVSSIPANGIFLTKNLKNKNKNAQRVEND